MEQPIMRIPLATAVVPRRQAQGSAFMVQVGAHAPRSGSTATTARSHVSLAATQTDSPAMHSRPLPSLVLALLLSVGPVAGVSAGDLSV
ncbi:MAG TPA: hypothetical protein VN205_05300, partial [Thermomonas sp.]|nr:hypothetical protein [Thermomonas sp.]